MSDETNRAWQATDRRVTKLERTVAALSGEIDQLRTTLLAALTDCTQRLEELQALPTEFEKLLGEFSTEHEKRLSELERRLRQR